MNKKVISLLTLVFLLFSFTFLIDSLNKTNLITALIFQDVDIGSVEEFSATITENNTIEIKYNENNYLLLLERVYQNYVEFRLDFQRFRLYLRETKELDLNNDAINDVSLTLDSILGKDTSFTVKRIICITNWYCTSFSNCQDGIETRDCFDLNKCLNPTFRPELTKPCIASCNDNVKNQDEVGVDCGGPCKPCQVNTKYIYFWAGIPILIAMLAIVISLVVIKIKEKPYRALEKPLSKRHIEIKPEIIKQKIQTREKQALTKIEPKKVEVKLSKEEEAALKELQDYIKEALNRDVPISEIKENLIVVGWPESVINENIISIKAKIRK